jgi:hypothetical protein
MRPTRRTYSVAAGGVATAIALTLTAGCSSSSSDKPTPSATSTEPAPKVTSTAPPLVQNSLPRSIPNSPSVRKNVVITSCQAGGGGWIAKGTAKNTETKEATFRITVFFTATGGTVQDYAATTVKVAPGATGNWTAAKKFAAQKTTTCVLTGAATA